jgi:hypothetical protein
VALRMEFIGVSRHLPTGVMEGQRHCEQASNNGDCGRYHRGVWMSGMGGKTPGATDSYGILAPPPDLACVR